jgi:lysophospholipase L1-like esterase
VPNSPRSTRRLSIALVIGLVIIFSLFAAQFLLTPPVVIEDTRSGGQVYFSAEPGIVFAPGGCITANWRVDNIQEVYFNSRGTVGEGSDRACVTISSMPTLRVVFQDGTSRDYRLEIAFFLQRPINWLLGLVTVFLTVALVYLLGARLLGGRSLTSQPRVRSLVRVLAGTVLGLVIAALFFEVGLRAYFNAFGTEAEKVAYVMTREEIDRLDPYVIALPEVDYALSGEHSQNNALGYRGEEIQVPKPDGVFRIVTLGDSTTYGTSVKANETYPYFLQQILRDEYGLTNVEVVNGGILGYTTYQIVSTMALRVPELEPDLVILFESINDLMPRGVNPGCYRGANPLLGLDPRGRVASSARGQPCRPARSIASSVSTWGWNATRLRLAIPSSIRRWIAATAARSAKPMRSPPTRRTILNAI